MIRFQSENARPVTGEPPRQSADPYYEDRHNHDDHKYGGHGWKKKSWLGDLFD